MAISVTDTPSFTCSSNELLWGQLHCIAEGFLDSHNNSQFSVPGPFSQGTIIRRNFGFRIKAALGEWTVAEIESRIDFKYKADLLGFIVYHKNLADPVEIVKRCAKVGISNTQDHDDKSIVYVNRYDWSWMHEVTESVENLLFFGEEVDSREKIEKMKGQRFIIADAIAGSEVIDHLKQSVSDGMILENSKIKETMVVDSNPVGFHLACPDTEYELGWMVFDTPERKELIAFVYDGSYTALEGELSLSDGRSIITNDDWLARLAEYKRINDELEATYYAARVAEDVEAISVIFNNRNGKNAEEMANEFHEIGFRSLPVTSDYWDPYRNVDDLQQIVDAFENLIK